MLFFSFLFFSKENTRVKKEEKFSVNDIQWECTRGSFLLLRRPRRNAKLAGRMRSVWENCKPESAVGNMCCGRVYALKGKRRSRSRFSTGQHESPNCKNLKAKKKIKKKKKKIIRTTRNSCSRIKGSSHSFISKNRKRAFNHIRERVPLFYA